MRGDGCEDDGRDDGSSGDGCKGDGRGDGGAGGRGSDGGLGEIGAAAGSDCPAPGSGGSDGGMARARTAWNNLCGLIRIRGEYTRDTEIKLDTI